MSKLEGFKPIPTTKLGGAAVSTADALKHLEAQQKMIIEYLQYIVKPRMSGGGMSIDLESTKNITEKGDDDERN